MAEVRHLNNAPITEALIDIRVKLSANFKVVSFLGFKENFGERYPKIEERKLFTGQIGIEKGKLQPPTAKYHGTHGYFFKPEVAPKVVQFRVDGFTFSILKPYTNWEEMVEEAKELWRCYRGIAQPEAVTRLAVRYINHINIPLPVEDLSVYFTAPPKVPDGIDWPINGFLSKVVTVDQTKGIATNIVQALESSHRPGKHITIVLDIDSYKTGFFDQNSDEIWHIFGELHNIKNHVFFKSITEETARMHE